MSDCIFCRRFSLFYFLFQCSCWWRQHTLANSLSLSLSRSFGETYKMNDISNNSEDARARSTHDTFLNFVHCIQNTQRKSNMKCVYVSCIHKVWVKTVEKRQINCYTKNSDRKQGRRRKSMRKQHLQALTECFAYALNIFSSVMNES